MTALTLERERLRLEREVARAAELALRETNERMDEFLSIATHEMKSPLTNIRMSIQLVRRRLKLLQTSGNISAVDAQTMVTPLDDMLRRVEGQVDRQTRLINDLLDISRIQTGHLDLEMEMHDLTTIVRECIDELRLAWLARTVELDLPDEPVLVQADADRVAQVVTNYVTNALKYSASDQAVAVSLSVEEQTAIVRVRDQGPGLTVEQQRQVWERYRRVESVPVQDASPTSGGGLGLGLYISRTIVAQHGGQVGVDSTPGAGATFWFVLPLSENSMRQYESS